MPREPSAVNTNRPGAARHEARLVEPRRRARSAIGPIATAAAPAPISGRRSRRPSASRRGPASPPSAGERRRRGQQAGQACARLAPWSVVAHRRRRRRLRSRSGAEASAAVDRRQQVARAGDRQRGSAQRRQRADGTPADLPAHAARAASAGRRAARSASPAFARTTTSAVADALRRRRRAAASRRPIAARTHGAAATQLEPAAGAGAFEERRARPRGATQPPPG